ncbi:MAG: hypothetical protein AUF67_02385 [Acidobacteria bacterium 13_1_20CM_58_21]|nr:MAG: hypothetical protein AUF67_02385 [Acidobacteria bacterium 13_1_20CM_58_21]
MARFTALTPKYIEETNLRINPSRWFKELERDKRRTIGRLDSRFEGMDADAAGEPWSTTRAKRLMRVPLWRHFATTCGANSSGTATRTTR